MSETFKIGDRVNLKVSPPQEGPGYVAIVSGDQVAVRWSSGWTAGGPADRLRHEPEPVAVVASGDYTQDDLLEFVRIVRWLTKDRVKLTQTDAAAELDAINARYKRAG